MKYLQDFDGNTITTPDETYLFKRTISFLTWAIRGDFSTTFSVPNDSETRKTLGYYSVNQINRPTEKIFAFVFDGTTVSYGRAFIQSVGSQFELFFVAGNSNWINEITGSIRDIDFSDFDCAFDAPTIDSRKTATEGVIFPVIDWAYNYKKLTNVFLARPITGVSIDSFYDFYPCFHEHTIFDRIFSTLGFKIAGNLLDNPVYKDLVITSSEILSATYQSALNTSVAANQTMDTNYLNSSVGTPAFKIDFQVGSSFFDAANDRLVFPTALGPTLINYSIAAGKYSINPEIYYTIQLRKNGITISTVEIPVTYAHLSPFNGSITTDIQANDYFELWLQPHDAFVSGFPRQFIANVTTFITTIITSDGVAVSNLLPDVAQFDFVRHIAQRFNCLVDYDDLTQTVTFTMLDSVKKENAVDLSDNIIEFTHAPSGYGQRNYIRTPEAAELVLYKSDNKNYGDHEVDSDGQGEKDVINTIFRPAETFTNQKLEWLITNVPLIRLEDSDDGVDYVSVEDPTGISGRAIFINATLLADFIVDSVIRIKSDSGEYEGMAVVESADNAGLMPYGVKIGSTDTGKIYRQKIIFPSIGSRELIVVRNTDVNNFNTGSPIYDIQNIKILDANGTYPYGSAAWAFYAKPNIGTNMDRVRVGLNYGPVTNTGNISFGDLFHKTLRKIIAGPKTKAKFLLSQVEYQNLSPLQYVYLRTKSFEGYFLMPEIDGFKNQFSPVEANLILIE